jgi:hypothetical protein
VRATVVAGTSNWAVPSGASWTTTIDGSSTRVAVTSASATGRPSGVDDRDPNWELPTQTTPR